MTGARERLGEEDVGGAFTPSAEHTRHLERAKVRAHKTPGTCKSQGTQDSWNMQKSGQRHSDTMEGDGQRKRKLRNF